MIGHGARADGVPIRPTRTEPCWKREAQLRAQLPLSLDPMRIFDFFAGGGCFSTAAALEGVEVALGVDDWSVALSTFWRNHPAAAARGTTLPATWAALCACRRRARRPTRCTRTSAHTVRRLLVVAPRAQDRGGGRARRAPAHTWSVEFAVRHGLASYSVENVAVDAVKRLFRRLKECHPDGFDYVELKAERLGAACEHTRLVGGAPVARLKALPALKAPQLRTMRQAFEAAGVAVPAEATHVRFGSRAGTSRTAAAAPLRCAASPPSARRRSSRAVRLSSPRPTARRCASWRRTRRRR